VSVDKDIVNNNSIKLPYLCTTQIRIKKSLDLKMKEIGIKHSKTKAQVFEDAVRAYLANKNVLHLNYYMYHLLHYLN